MSIRKATYEEFARNIDDLVERGEVDPAKRQELLRRYVEENGTSDYDVRRVERNLRVKDFSRKMMVLVGAGKITKQEAKERIDAFISEVIMPEAHQDNLAKERDDREELYKMFLICTVYTLRFLFILVPRFVLVTVPVSAIRFARSAIVKIELATRPTMKEV